MEEEVKVPETEVSAETTLEEVTEAPVEVVEEGSEEAVA